MSLGLFIDSFVYLKPGSRDRPYLKDSMVLVQVETKSSFEKEGGAS